MSPTDVIRLKRGDTNVEGAIEEIALQFDGYSDIAAINLFSCWSRGGEYNTWWPVSEVEDDPEQDWVQLVE